MKKVSKKKVVKGWVWLPSLLKNPTQKTPCFLLYEPQERTDFIPCTIHYQIPLKTKKA